MSESRPDPRKRPPDPAGTQPKVDPASLRAALTAGSGEDHERELPVTASASASPNGAIGLATSTAVLAPSADPSIGDSDARTAIDDVVIVTDGAQRGGPLTVPARVNPHAPRFQFLFGALGALSVAAIALVIALLRSPAPAPERPWSAWEPTSSGVDPAQQIAAHVAPQYRLANGRQIVDVAGGPPTLKGQPLTIGVIHSGQTPAPLEGNNVLYQLCGNGSDCSIKEGKPSTQRGLLVAREALELALYTFRYVSGVDRVLVTLPPPPPASLAKTSGSKAIATSSAQAAAGTSTTAAGAATTSGAARVPRHALIFSQQDLAPELSQPLGATLSTATPSVSQMNGWPDALAVKTLTEPHLYDFTVSETQQGLVMLLEPPGLGG
ncbi:MAG TPA: hypothetical protein VGI76_05185 [Solirubrobacteraceae bacterium]|jgi:hypothetical protein